MKHIYYDENGDEDYSDWEIRKVGFTKRTSHHGLYSGPGSISLNTTKDLSKKKDYLFNFQPIDYPDAIAKRHDEDYTLWRAYSCVFIVSQSVMEYLNYHLIFNDL